MVAGRLEAAQTLYAADWLFFGGPNHSGIGRGYYTEVDFRLLTGWMKDVFEKAGAPLADVRFCPHHPDAAVPEYRCRYNCRKPAPGMILEAAETLGIDLTQSVMVGDKQGDMQAAKAAGMEAHNFEEKDALKKYLAATANRGDVIWCKASHGMALEEVIAAFYRDYHA